MKFLGKEFKFNGNDIFHTGNFDPNKKADVTQIPTKLSQLQNDIGAGGGSAIIIQSTPPTNPQKNQIWIQI